MASSGELIRMMNYVDDISTTCGASSSAAALCPPKSARSWPSTCATPIPISPRWSISWRSSNAASGRGDHRGHRRRQGGTRVGPPRRRRRISRGPRRPHPTSLDSAWREIRQTLNDEVAAARLQQPEADQALARIECVTRIEDAARRARIVMETGPDEQESKLEMFCLLDRICLPGTVIVSNCHALDLSDTAAKAEIIVGLYFSGDHAEIHCSEFTSERALAVAIKLAERMAATHRITRDAHSAATP